MLKLSEATWIVNPISIVSACTIGSDARRFATLTIDPTKVQPHNTMCGWPRESSIRSTKTVQAVSRGSRGKLCHGNVGQWPFLTRILSFYVMLPLTAATTWRSTKIVFFFIFLHEIPHLGRTRQLFLQKLFCNGNYPSHGQFAFITYGTVRRTDLRLCVVLQLNAC